MKKNLMFLILAITFIAGCANGHFLLTKLEENVEPPEVLLVNPLHIYVDSFTDDYRDVRDSTAEDTVHFSIISLYKGEEDTTYAYFVDDPYEPPMGTPSVHAIYETYELDTVIVKFNILDNSNARYRLSFTVSGHYYSQRTHKYDIILWADTGSTMYRVIVPRSNYVYPTVEEL